MSLLDFGSEYIRSATVVRALAGRAMRLARLWPILIAAGCSGSSPHGTPPPSHEPQSGTVGLDSNPVQTTTERRVTTTVEFEICRQFPDFEFNNGGKNPQHSILETLGGGVAVFDFDRDGWPDICLAGGGGPVSRNPGSSVAGTSPFLLLNPGGRGGAWQQVSRQAGLADCDLFSLGVATADFNNDGFTDLCVTGYGPLMLFQNQGDGTLLECALDRGILDLGFAASAAWGDVNNDGALDLYVCHYVAWNMDAEEHCQERKAKPSEICGPRNFAAESDLLFVSAGDGCFQDRSAAMGLEPGGKGLGVVIGDVDCDGDADIYVANDTTANFLYLNDGQGHLREVAALHGVAYDENGRPTGSMGVALADYDNDGLPDLWTTNFEFEALALFRNMGHAQFHSVSRPAGVTALYGQYVSWGTAFADFDSDGDLDIVVANGHLPDYVPAEKLAQRPFLLINDGQRRFAMASVADSSYFAAARQGRGLATADFDCDGRMDLVISHLTGPATVLRNSSKVDGATVQVALVGRDSNRDAVAARVVLESSIGSQLRQANGGGSYLSTSEAILHWGFPAETVLDKLTVYWPSGKVQVVDLVSKTLERNTALQMRIIEP